MVKRIKPIFEEGYFYKMTPEGHKFKVMRAGAETSHPARGGTWYEVELWPGKRSGYMIGEGRYGMLRIGGKTVFRKEITLKNPYLFEIPEVKAEGEIPIKLWKKVTGKILKSRKGFFGSKAEQRYSALEREIADVLKKKGYDGIVLYNKVGVHEYPVQIFKFSEI